MQQLAEAGVRDGGGWLMSTWLLRWSVEGVRLRAWGGELNGEVD